MRLSLSAFTLTLSLVIASLSASGKVRTDTLSTIEGDRVIITYNVVQNGQDVQVSANSSGIRFLPTDRLRDRCDGDLGKLKAVVFDQIGRMSSVTFNGEQPRALGTPANVSHTVSDDGYYILGQSAPIRFTLRDDNKATFTIPVYIVQYEKKNRYRIIGQTRNGIQVCVNDNSADSQSTAAARQTRAETVTISSTSEIESDNDDIVEALECIAAVEDRLATVTQLPFPRSLDSDIETLYALKRRVNDSGVRSRIEQVLKACEDKENELREADEAQARQQQVELQAMAEQQRLEDLQRQKEAEEKAQQDAEKQQKRNIWMIIGGAILGVLCFVFNGVFRHFRDTRNQKNMFEMQQSLTRQAQNAATRRARQLAHSKAQQVVNQGRNKARSATRDFIQKTKNKSDDNNGVRSI